MLGVQGHNPEPQCCHIAGDRPPEGTPVGSLLGRASVSSSVKGARPYLFLRLRCSHTGGKQLWGDGEGSTAGADCPPARKVKPRRGYGGEEEVTEWEEAGRRKMSSQRGEAGGQSAEKPCLR